ncbi:multidrug resistance-associated protein 5-like [Argonauta hians]
MNAPSNPPNQRERHRFWKLLLPFHCEKLPDTRIPFYDVGLFSFISISWMTKMIWKIFRRGGENTDFWQCPHPLSAHYNIERIEKLWDQEVEGQGSKASMSRVLTQSSKITFTLATVICLVSFLFKMTIPFYFVPTLLEFVENDRYNYKRGITLAASLFFVGIMYIIFYTLNGIICYEAAISFKVALNSLLFKKVLTVKSLGDKSVGEVINMFTGDSEKVMESILLSSFIIGCPVTIVIGLIYNYYLLGPLSLIGSFVFVGFYPALILVNNLQIGYKKRVIKITDKRINITNEVINYIRLIKMYAWEDSFISKIIAIRLEEKKLLDKCGYLQALISCLPELAPVAGIVLTFLAFIFIEQDLTITKAITMVTVLNNLHGILNMIPMAVKTRIDAMVCLKRYQDFFLLEHLERFPSDNLKDQETVVLDKATLNWNITKTSAVDAEVDKCNGNGSKIEKSAGEHESCLSENIESKTEHESCLSENIESKTEHESCLSENIESKTEHESCLSENIESKTEPTLKNIDLVLENGKMIGICGSTGSGKSSLLAAILGRMNVVSGKISCRGTIAYVSQQSWIINGTVQLNIILGLPYKEHKFKKIIRICSLEEDFRDFPNGDLTEIGDRGINLSGGQKQRISLARALYSDSDIYLLDDPLSAVDAYLGKRIYDKCFNIFLCKKSVLFVTHQLEYLTSCAYIHFLKDGEITEQGTHQQLLDANQDYANLIGTFFTTSSSKVEKPPLQRGMSTISTISQHSVISNDQLFELVTKEDISKNISFRQVKMYLKASGGVIQCLLVLLLFAICVGLKIFILWLTLVILKKGHPDNYSNIKQTQTMENNISYSHLNISSFDDSTYTSYFGMFNADYSEDFKISLYCGTGLLLVLFQVVRGIFFNKTIHKGSTRFHEKLLRHIIGMPMSFFDSTPTGRMINRFSTDMYELDSRLFMSFDWALSGILTLLAAFISLILIVPLTAGFLILLVVSLIGIIWVFARILVDIKKLERSSLSPLLTLIGNSLDGLTSLVAYRKNNLFFNWFSDLQNKNTSLLFTLIHADLWSSIRMYFISTLMQIVFVASVIYWTHIPAGLVGLGMIFSMQFIDLLYMVTRISIDAVIRLEAVKRIAEYIEVDNDLVNMDIEPAKEILPDWMDVGHIMFVDYSMRYRFDLPNALKRIHLQILPGEKIGIAGRSGSGKSSLGLALFRMVEPFSGTIFIDGQDITEVSLKELRSRISIIPQEPVLFIGTIRYNLDPFNNYTDQQIWSALEKCYMKNAVFDLKDRLEYDVGENGKNFSVGQRQLLCLARVLLRNNKILVLDEATSSVDVETDSLVQQTIKECFSDCTLMIIAHRLTTIIECDKIIIMDSGKVIEEGKPNELLKKTTSKFYRLWKAGEIM